MVSQQTQQGFFSLLRWRTDPVRDEARNIAVVLVEAKGGYGGLRHVALSAVSPRLHEQGILDAALVALEEQVSDARTFTLERLTAMHRSMHQSLYLTKPKPVAVADRDKVLEALYRAYIAPRGSGGRRPTKSVVLDRVVRACRAQGIEVRRGAYIEDFIFDAVIPTSGHPRVIEVLSFAAERKDWAPIERDAGHFLFALGQLGLVGAAVVQPPSPASQSRASEPYRRVRRWLDKHGVQTVTPDEATSAPDLVAGTTHPLFRLPAST